LLEDVGVTLLVVLAITFPLITVIVVSILVVAATTITIMLWKVARRAWRRVGDWLGARTAAT